MYKTYIYIKKDDNVENTLVIYFDNNAERSIYIKEENKYCINELREYWAAYGKKTRVLTRNKLNYARLRFAKYKNKEVKKHGK